MVFQQGRRRRRNQRRTLRGTLRILTSRERCWEMIFNILLLDRYTFGQIPRLIHIRTAQHRNMVRQELQWYCK